MENESSIKNLITESLQQIRTFIDADTIVGKQIVTPSGTVIIPISKLSMGFASGGLDLPSKKTGAKSFGGGGGTGVTVSPIGFLVVSSDGNFLIQRRSEKRKLMPGEWAATGGSAISGESSLAAAARELREELGIKALKGSLKLMGRLKRRNSFLDVWFIKCDADISRLRLQKSEVAEVKWVTPDELKAMIDGRNYHNYGREYFKAVFEYAEKMRQQFKEQI